MAASQDITEELVSKRAPHQRLAGLAATFLDSGSKLEVAVKLTTKDGVETVWQNPLIDQQAMHHGWMSLNIPNSNEVIDEIKTIVANTLAKQKAEAQAKQKKRKKDQLEASCFFFHMTCVFFIF